MNSGGRLGISVIVATYNRAESLRLVVEGLAAQVYPRECFEAIVVDNNSSDETPSIVQKAQRGHPDVSFRYLFESRQGKSFALNAGVAAARYGILAFTDDDMELDPYWLNGFEDGFDQSDLSVVAGRVFPRAECELPRWLDRRLFGTAFAKVDLGGVPKVADGNFPGCNIAFRREVFHRYGGFRTDLGPGIKGAEHGEDGELFFRIRKAGVRIWYAPGALAFHKVPAERLTKRFLRRRFISRGLSHGKAVGLPRSLAAETAKEVSQAAWRGLLFCYRQCTLTPAKAFRHECQALWHLAYLWRLLGG